MKEFGAFSGQKHGLRRPDVPSVPPQEISTVITAFGSASEESVTLEMRPHLATKERSCGRSRSGVSGIKSVEGRGRRAPWVFAVSAFQFVSPWNGNN